MKKIFIHRVLFILLAFLFADCLLYSSENAEIRGPNKICIGDTILLSAYPLGNNLKYEWSTGDTTQTISLTKGGSFYLVVTEANVSTSIAYHNVTEYEKPEIVIQAKGRTSLCEGDTLELKAISVSSFYSWQINYKEDFDFRKSYPEWTTTIKNFNWQNPVKVDSNIKPYKRFLGPFGNQTVNLKLSKIPPHDSVEIQFDVLAIGTWDGNKTGKNGPDIFRIEEDIEKKFLYETSFSLVEESWQSFPDAFLRGTHRPKSGSSEEFILTTTSIYGNAVKYKMILRFRHLSDSLKFQISALLKDDVPMLTNESWALDNFRVLLRTKFSDSTNLKFSWNTGDSTKIIQVASSGIYRVVAENEGGCSDSSEINIVVNEKPEIKIIGRSVFCSSEFITLSADRDYPSYFWSTGEKTKSIQVNTPGNYNLIVTDSNGCSTDETIEVKLNWLRSVRIISDSILCRDAQMTLSTNDDFSQYLWSTGEKTKDIIVDKSGIYSVSVLDSNDCSSEDSYKIIDYDYKFSYPQDYDFGKVTLGGKPFSIFQLKNTGMSDISLRDVRFLSGSDIFTVVSTPLAPFLFAQSELMELNVTFAPKLKGIYYDTLLLEIDKPCAWLLRIPIKGLCAENDTFQLTVNFPDTSAVIGNTDFHLPLSASVNTKTPFKNLTYSTEIAFDASYYFPDLLESGEIVDNKVINGERIMSITGIIPQISQEQVKIFNLRGLVILGNKSKTPLKINSFSINDSNIHIIKNNGSLKVEGVCSQNISSVQLFTPTVMTYQNTPSGSIINIVSKKQGDYLLNIYSLIGEKVFSCSFKSQSNSDNYAIPIDIENFSNGIYSLILRSPDEITAKSILINK